MQLDLMIEGQEGVTWTQWQAIANACERHGISTLFRSDHYLNLDGNHPERGALDALGTSIALAATTTKLRLGTMVSPATFRHPSVLAKLATTADVISEGRFELGLGAGWHEREHAAYGFTYPDMRTRMAVFAEQLQVVLGNWSEQPFSFNGEHYKLDKLDAQPKPAQKPHPPLIMGGSAGPKVAALAAKFADEYNTTGSSPEDVRERKARIDAACEREGREPIPFSVMATVILGSDESDLAARVRRSAPMRGADPDEVLRQRPRDWIVGTIEQAAEQLRAYQQAGASRVMCQHPAHDDLEMVALLGEELAPLLA